MSEDIAVLIQRRLRSPRSAAVAGILYSILTTISILLVSNMVAAAPAAIDRDWLETWSDPASLVLVLIPFAGIFFLWFTGVIRERIGDREDRFFATIYFGSAIALIVLSFIWAATIGAIFGAYAVAAEVLVDNNIFIFGFALMGQITGNYFIRMAGVYMLSIGTVWTKAEVMPRWLTIITFIVALGFLFFASAIREALLIFPAWVFLVSVYLLILNYRRSNEEPG
ncbi:MAG: hypothetical protein ACC647_04420 [Anaerolineales bacterium]